MRGKERGQLFAVLFIGNLHQKRSFSFLESDKIPKIRLHSSIICVHDLIYSFSFVSLHFNSKKKEHILILTLFIYSMHTKVNTNILKMYSGICYIAYHQKGKDRTRQERRGSERGHVGVFCCRKHPSAMIVGADGGL